MHTRRASPLLSRPSFAPLPETAVLIAWNPQKVTVRLGSVKEEKVAAASVRAKMAVLPSPGAYMVRRLG